MDTAIHFPCLLCPSSPQVSMSCLLLYIPPSPLPPVFLSFPFPVLVDQLCTALRAPGGLLCKPTLVAAPVPWQVIELCRPLDSRLEHVDFESLFSSLSVRHLVSVFASLLLERRVIFIADKLRYQPLLLLIIRVNDV